MEEGKGKSRRSQRLLSEVDTSNMKVNRKNQKKGQVPSPTIMDEVNNSPNFSLRISQVSGEQNNVEKNKKLTK